MTPKQRAERAARAMWDQDKASSFLGLRLEDVDEGSARMSLEVADHHTNGHGMCHGGIIFTLADSAFAFACNSRNQSTVAYHNSITYVAPAALGDLLQANAREISVTRKNGIYDVEVTNQDGTLIAQFRGMSRAIRGRLFDEDNPDNSG